MRSVSDQHNELLKAQDQHTKCSASFRHSLSSGPCPLCPWDTTVRPTRNRRSGFGGRCGETESYLGMEAAEPQISYSMQPALLPWMVMTPAYGPDKAERPEF